MATVARNSRGGIKKTGRNTQSSSVGSSSTQVGLNQSQMNQLKNSSWADKGALASYERSGSVVGGRNNPNGRGRENVAAIPADSMNPVAPMQLPSIPAPTDPGNVLAPTNIGLQSTAEGMYTVDPATGMMTMAPATDGFEQNQQGRLAEMFKAYEGLGSGEADLAKLEKENKLAQKRQAIASLTGSLNSIVASSQAEQLKLEGQGRGQTTGFIGGEQARINREAAIAALPVQAQLAAAQGDLAMAEAHVDKLFQIKRQDAQALFNFKAQVINSVYDFADKQEQRRLDEVNKIETRKYEEQQDFLKTQRSLLSSALQQGAPSSVVNAINGATTQEEALIAAGEYNGDVLARQERLASIAATNALAAQRSGSTTGVGATINAATDLGLTGTDEDPMLAIIANSAGGRVLTQSEAEPLTNAKRVADGLADLQAVINTSNTDPILGLFQKVNPYNLNAKAIDTAINTLVPQLARGTYGEVGVLTDADMTRYANTLPNLTSTDDQNKAVMALTLRKVRSGFASQIESMAAAGRDVSGYKDIYTNFSAQIRGLESQIGIGEASDTDIDAEYDTAFGKAWEIAQKTPTESSGGGVWKSIGRFFFGE